MDVTEGSRDFYVVPGDELRAGVRERHEELMASVGGVRSGNQASRHTAIYRANVEARRNRWSLFDGVAQPAAGGAASD